MAVDTTVLTFNCNPMIEVRANRGANLEVGNVELQYAPTNNPSITAVGTKGWRSFGISETNINFQPTIETTQPKVGTVKTSRDSFEVGRMLEIPVSIIAPTWTGKKFAMGSANASFTYASPAVATDIDSAVTLVDPYMQIGVTAVTGFAVGDMITVVTGDAEFGTEEEPVEIALIDTVNKVITLKFPLQQLPEDAALVRKITRATLPSVACELPDRVQVRAIKRDRSARRIIIEHAPDAKIKNITGADNGDGTVPTKYGFTLEAFPTYNLVDSKLEFAQRLEIY